MVNIKLSILILLGITLSACSGGAGAYDSTHGEDDGFVNNFSKKVSDPISDELAISSYTIEEIEKKRGSAGCWIIIDEMVYDISQYINRALAPSGDPITQYCGEDASKIFDDVEYDNITKTILPLSLFDKYLIGRVDRERHYIE